MKRSLAAFLLLLAAAGAQAQTIEGYWQDAARRILFDRSAPPSYVYGAWHPLDLDQTYPAAKAIRRSGEKYELVDLNFDEQYGIKIVAADEKSIRFVRTSSYPACAMHHSCRLDGEQQLLCALENRCQVDGREVLDWRGEERYVRRASCERDGKVQAQGIPVKCR